MRLRVLLAIAVLSGGCALLGAPPWVQQGYAVCGPIRCRGVLSGVGHAGYNDTIIEPSLRRTAAAAAARAALVARIQEALKLKDTDPTKTFIAGTVNGAEIMDRWVGMDETEYAIAEMNRLSFHLALQQQPGMTPELLIKIEEQMSPVFQGVGLAEKY